MQRKTSCAVGQNQYKGTRGGEERAEDQEIHKKKVQEEDCPRRRKERKDGRSRKKKSTAENILPCTARVWPNFSKKKKTIEKEEGG